MSNLSKLKEKWDKKKNEVLTEEQIKIRDDDKWEKQQRRYERGW